MIPEGTSIILQDECRGRGDELVIYWRTPLYPEPILLGSIIDCRGPCPCLVLRAPLGVHVIELILATFRTTRGGRAGAPCT